MSLNYRGATRVHGAWGNKPKWYTPFVFLTDFGKLFTICLIINVIKCMVVLEIGVVMKNFHFDTISNFTQELQVHV